MPQEQMMTLGALRNRMKLTQQEVAEAVDVTRETIIRWEKDSSDMPVRYMFVFSELYKYPLNGIFFWQYYRF